MSDTFQDDTFPVLYILMRNDLASMNAGKAMAQASHASNAFIKVMFERGILHEKDDSYDDIDALGVKWCAETPQGFGTVFVLAVNEKQMRSTVDVAKALGFVADVIHDPTYPLLDGEVCHHLALDTCAYVFGDKNNPMLSLILGRFPLHP